MAGMGRDRDTRAPRSSGGDRSWPVLAVASAAVSGSGTGTATPKRTRTRRVAQPAVAAATEQATQVSAPVLRTRATYRMLLMRGLAPEEAANLTAFLSGIHVGDQTWKLTEINRLLFLRELQHNGRFDETDGRATIS
jgi:hypothetical protein